MRAAWWWIDRWRTSVAYMTMPLAEQGAYRNLIDELWLRDGLLPGNERFLAMASGAGGEWEKVRAGVMAHFYETPDGWRNKTHDEVMAESKRRSEKQARWRSRAGNVGGNKSGNVTSNVTPSLSPDLSLSPDQAKEDKKIPSESLSEPSASDVKKPRRARVLPSVEAVRLADGLLGSIRSHTPAFRGPSSLDGWARAVDLMIRVDGRAPGEIEEVIRWAHGSPEGSFWRGNILSGDTLRRQFDRLVVQMRERGRGGRASPSDILKMAAEMEAAERNGSVS